jgi:hypothetical protein
MFRFASILLLVVLMTVPVAPARASDAGDILGAIVAGYLIYDTFDDARHAPPPPRHYMPPPRWDYGPPHRGRIEWRPDRWGYGMPPPYEMSRPPECGHRPPATPDWWYGPQPLPRGHRELPGGRTGRPDGGRDGGPRR